MHIPGNTFSLIAGTASLQGGNASHCAVLISHTFDEYLKKQGRKQPAQAKTYASIQKECLHFTEATDY